MAETAPVRRRIEGERKREILDAVITVLLDLGYDKLTFDLVSSEAHVSKATLYRKWPSKADLVLAALEQSSTCSTSSLPHWDTGSLAGDLAAMAEWTHANPSNMQDVVGAVASALHRDAELRDGFWRTFKAPRVARLEAMLLRAQQRGEVRSDADVRLLALVIPAFALQHTLQHGASPDVPYMTSVVEQVLLPAATTSLNRKDPDLDV